MSKPKLKVVGEAPQSALLYTPWKTTYDVPGGNGRIAETALMDQRKAIDFIMELATRWGDLYPELAEVDPELPGIAGTVIEGEHIQSPIRMLGYTMHGDCADLLCGSGAIYHARNQLKRRADGTWESPMGIAALFQQPDAPQDHVAWDKYDLMATRPRQLGGWFDTVKGMVKKVAPHILKTAVGTVAPWAIPLIKPATKYAGQALSMLAKSAQPGARPQLQLPTGGFTGGFTGGIAAGLPRFAQNAMQGLDDFSMRARQFEQPDLPQGYGIRPGYAQDVRGSYIPQREFRYRAVPAPRRPFGRFPTKPRPEYGETAPLYLPPEVAAGAWKRFSIRR